MSIDADELTRRYADAMRVYLLNPSEASLETAYRIGRMTVGAGLGVMELARAHGLAMVSSVAQAADPSDIQDRCHLASRFFQESLWSFEMIHRGFRESNQLLRDSNGVLELRARQLLDMNRELSREVAERRRAEDALRQSETALRRLSNQILVAQEEERKRISRELHDEVGQALTAINMNLDMLKKKAANRLLVAHVTDLQSLLQQTMETVHSFTRELRPAMLDHLGLVPALRAYVRNFRKRTGLRVRFRATKEVELLGGEEKTVLYRVTQEGLTNVARHSGASQASISIRRLERAIRMEVQDNGKAFRVEAISRAKDRRRLGLVGIQERVRLVNGEFMLESEPGKGTMIRVQLPLRTHAK
jgi:two-component system sensor histidine kinase DegS